MKVGGKYPPIFATGWQVLRYWCRVVKSTREVTSPLLGSEAQVQAPTGNPLTP